MPVPADIANRALDAAGSSVVIGDLEQGTREAQIVLRHYGPVLRQLLRSAYWDMARKQAPLQMLADATGQTAAVGTAVPQPWTYEYAYPTDCVAIRLIPANNVLSQNGAPPGNISIGTQTTMTGLGNIPPSNANRLVPSRFVVSTDYNYPAQVQPGPGGTPWWDQAGISPTNRTVILSNVNQALAIYTCLQTAPSLWDPLFEEAFVAALAERIAVPLAIDKKAGMALRAQNMAIAMDRIRKARAASGNEGWTSTDNIPDWIRIRASGAGRSYGLLGGGWDGPGVFNEGWGAYGFSNGSAF